MNMAARRYEKSLRVLKNIPRENAVKYKKKKSLIFCSPHVERRDFLLP